MTPKPVIEVSPLVRWIGILDPDIVTFDVVMETKFGTTYNSYFINAQRKTIIETSKETFRDVYLEKVNSVCNPAEIEYIILNHTEPDHSGNLRHLLEIAPSATVIGSGTAIRYLQDIVGKPFRNKVVKDGDTLDLGNCTLRFIAAPNLHWPDTMYTFLVEEGILFSCDSFGAHFCHPAMFDDLVGDFEEAYRYYFDVILKPFSKFMLKAIDRIKDLPITCICNGHGPILRKNWKHYVQLAENWSKEYIELHRNQKPKIYIPYVSAYGYTGEMARLLGEAIHKAGDIDVFLQDIEHSPLEEVETRIVESNGILVGCPTLNQNILLPIYKLFSVISPIRDRGKIAGAFGSFGWSGEGVRLIEENLKNLKLKVPVPGVAVKFLPNEDTSKKIEDFGFEFGEELILYFRNLCE
jgi:flavorubredoxin